VDTYGNRNTAHVFGAVEIAEAPRFHYEFAEVFSGKTFHAFLVALVAGYDVAVGTPPKLFLIIDNGPCHHLSDEGKVWLAASKDRIELNRLPPYSPEYNGIEGCWKTTRKLTTRNAFFATPAGARHRALPHVRAVQGRARPGRWSCAEVPWVILHFGQGV
jgi:hypothetical protein